MGRNDIVTTPTHTPTHPIQASVLTCAAASKTVEIAKKTTPAPIDINGVLRCMNTGRSNCEDSLIIDILVPRRNCLCVVGAEGSVVGDALSSNSYIFAIRRGGARSSWRDFILSRTSFTDLARSCWSFTSSSPGSWYVGLFDITTCREWMVALSTPWMNDWLTTWSGCSWMFCCTTNLTSKFK
jgi:hypothetical protein